MRRDSPAQTLSQSPSEGRAAGPFAAIYDDPTPQRLNAWTLQRFDTLSGSFPGPIWKLSGSP